VGDAEEEETDEENSPKTTNRQKMWCQLSRPPLRLALVGRPMSASPACSTSSLGEERSLTGPEAGLTRDSITAPGKRGRRCAAARHGGLRKKARVADESFGRNVGGLHPGSHPLADCVIVMIDATATFEKQDLTIAD